MAAVLHGLLFVIREIRVGGAAPDFELLRAMLHYLDTFSEQFHHPKEDEYLFRRLALRSPAAKPLLDRLSAEHASGGQRLADLATALDRYESDGTVRLAAFASGAASFAAFHWEHMRLEESGVIPLARVHLTSEDWRAIDAAFTGHTDPLLGAEKGDDFQQLFRRIVAMAPPPIGTAKR